MAQFEPALLMKWIFKTAISVWMISNTFDIIMAVFDVTQQVVANSSGIISGNTRVNDIGLSILQSSMMSIYYIESYGHTILVHSKGKDFQLRMNIQDAAKQLPKRCFTAPHRCYLVNMEHILYTSSDEIMLSNGAKLPISRRKRQEYKIVDFDCLLCFDAINS